MKLSRKQQIAWAAGLFEGEGCFSVSGSRRRRNGNCRVYPLLSLKMTDEDTVRRFAEIVGHGRINGPYKTKNKQCWVWYWLGDSALEWAFQNFSPYLSLRRTQRLKEIAEEIEDSIRTAGPKCLHRRTGSSLLQLFT